MMVTLPLSAAVSCQLCLARNSMVLNQPDSCIHEEIRNYLHYVPGESNNDPLVFWRQDLYLSLIRQRRST